MSGVDGEREQMLADIGVRTGTIENEIAHRINNPAYTGNEYKTGRSRAATSPKSSPKSNTTPQRMSTKSSSGVLRLIGGAILLFMVYVSITSPEKRSTSTPGYTASPNQTSESTASRSNGFDRPINKQVEHPAESGIVRTVPQPQEKTAVQSNPTQDISNKKFYAFENGNTYQGDLVNGRYSGYGIFTQPDGYRYEGYHVDGKPNGKAVEYGADGGKFEGKFVDGERNGYGVINWANGDRYEGYWANNLPNGKGIKTSADGFKYDGEFIAGMSQGRGIHTHSDGSRYEGEFVANNAQGYGTYTYSSGARHEGYFVKGKPHGRGTYIALSGVRYEGEYVDDKPSGMGTYTFQDGTTLEGEWNLNCIKGDPDTLKEKCSL